MGNKSDIEWTDASWSPIRARNLTTGKVGWHCEHATTGCEFCYAEDLNKWVGTGLPFKPGHRKDVEIFLDEDMLTAPLRWKKPRRIFACSMTDAFADFVKDEWLDKMFAVMALSPQHTFQVLTKRAERMMRYMQECVSDKGRPLVGVAIPGKREMLTAKPGMCLSRDTFAPVPLPNVWLGVSAERQQEWDERVPCLRDTPAAVRFVSYEPALGPLDITLARMWSDKPWLHWLICGGESGPHARPMNPQWARDVRDQCHAGGIAFFHKQNGEFVSVSEVEGAGAHFHFPDGRTVRRVGKKAAGRLLDGVEHNDFPIRARSAGSLPLTIAGNEPGGRAGAVSVRGENG